MSAVHLDSVSFSYTTAVPVLTDVDLHLGPGWHAVVGPNGAGKSTLCALIAGELSPTAGRVEVVSAVAPILCAQRVDQPGSREHAFAASWEPEHFALRGRLGLDPADLDRWESLSPGERKRWQVGAALAADPDVLCLDEPTNHLDVDARGVLGSELSRFRGVGVVVTHDRELLTQLCDRTLRVEAGRVELWSAPYPEARAAWEAAESAELAEHEALRREERKLQRRLAEQRRVAEQRAAGFARRMRTTSHRDHDAHSALTGGKAQMGQAAAARRIAVTRDQLDRTAAERAEIGVRRRPGTRVSFRGASAPRGVLVRREGPLRAGDTGLGEVSVSLGREDRVRLAGPNGSGKSTLLGALAAGWDLDPDRLLHLPQELTADAASRLLSRVRDLDREELGQVMQRVAALGVDPERLLASDRPSPGEARKLALARALGLEAWCLLLDEPTNHLDLPAIERLEEALAEYPGALVVVTHDDRFAEAVELELTWQLPPR